MVIFCSQFSDERTFEGKIYLQDSIHFAVALGAIFGDHHFERLEGGTRFV